MLNPVSLFELSLHVTRMVLELVAVAATLEGAAGIVTAGVVTVGGGVHDQFTETLLLPVDEKLKVSFVPWLWQGILNRVIWVDGLPGVSVPLCCETETPRLSLSCQLSV